jgi:hypothetical protein
MDKPSVLSEGDDPHGWISAIADKWRVVEQLQIGRRLVEGQAVSCSPYALSRGDFVDVGMGFDICTSRTPTGRMRNNVNLSMVHVLQLLPACMISKVSLFLYGSYIQLREVSPDRCQSSW